MTFFRIYQSRTILPSLSSLSSNVETNNYTVAYGKKDVIENLFSISEMRCVFEMKNIPFQQCLERLNVAIGYFPNLVNMSGNTILSDVTDEFFLQAVPTLFIFPIIHGKSNIIYIL